jgi:hypothetical protein
MPPYKESFSYLPETGVLWTAGVGCGRHFFAGYTREMKSAEAIMAEKLDAVALEAFEAAARLELETLGLDKFYMLDPYFMERGIVKLVPRMAQKIL